MALIPGARISMIREVATLLDKEEWADLDLVLDQHRLPTSDRWQGDGKRDYVIDMVKNAPDDALQQLYEYLTTSAGAAGVSPGQSPFKSERLHLFLSHLTDHRDLVGDVGRHLQWFGVEAFVAHDSIAPSKEWQQVIEAALSDCDGMAAFLHEGFRDSAWCDQELGWVMGRSRPILALSFEGVMPHGFVGKFQAQKVGPERSAALGDAILDWAVQQRTLNGKMAASLTAAFAESGSWNHTRAVSSFMDKLLGGFTDDQLNTLELAAVQNVDVSACDIFGTPGPEWVGTFVSRHRSLTGL